MNHTDHINLLRDGLASGGIWADLGSGSGAFTLALVELLGLGAEIYSVDKDRGALRTQERAMQTQFPQTTVHYLTADFTQPLDLPALDGIMLANTLHFQRYRTQRRVVELLKSHLRPGGRFIVIDYFLLENSAQL